MSQFDGFLSFIRRDVPLAMHTYLQLGGPAEVFAEPQTEEELIGLLKVCHAENVPVKVLGEGSNLLVSDDGVYGVVVSLSAIPFTGVTINDCSVTAGAGAKLSRVITQAVTAGLAGIESLIGIPGTLGGALHGNSGTNNGDIGQRVESVRVANMDGTVTELHRADLSFRYRSSNLDDWVVLSATLSLEKEDPAGLAKRMQKYWIVRKTQQPTSAQASGFAFKNLQAGVDAGSLIEQVGLKGTRIGGARIYERNANFIIIEPEGTVGDVQRLIQLVREQVVDRTEVELEIALDVW